MENNVQEDYKSEILDIVRSNASPGIMRDKLEDYHENDLAEVFPELTITERRKVYRILDIGMLSDIFEHIDEKQAAAYHKTKTAGSHRSHGCGSQKRYGSHRFLR